ncbi:MAG: hypothetical protein V9G09_05085 [Candidatus Nanopelagicales bacterium]
MSEDHYLDIEAVMDLQEIIASLQDLEDDTFERHGLTATGTWDEVDDPVLIGPEGMPVETWREGYPYTDRMTRHNYEFTKRLLQIELLKMQGWVKETGQRIVMVFEGRDAAGKGGTIKRFMEHMNPRGARVIALEKPSEREAGQWYFQRYIRHLPTKGEIVMFDRSWYNRAGVERVMGFCSDEDYAQFMRQTPEFEKMLVRDGIILIKFWFSVSRKEQITRFTIRRIDPGAAMETQPDGPRQPRPLAQVHRRQGGDVLVHRHRLRAVDRRAQQRQKARPARSDALGAQPRRLPRQEPRCRRHPGPDDRRSAGRHLRVRGEHGYGLPAAVRLAAPHDTLAAWVSTPMS